MALASVARGTGTNNASNTNGLAFSPSGNFASRSLAVLVVAYDNSGGSGADPFGSGSVTDSIGNTWTARHNTLRDPGAASAGIVLRIFTSDMNVGLLTTGSTVTLNTQTATTAKAGALWEVTAASNNLARYLSQGTGAGGASTAPSVTTSSITSGDLVVGGVAYEWGEAPATSDTDTSSGSWSTRQDTNIGGSSASGVSVCTQTKLTTGTATQTYNPTYTNSSDWAAGWISVDEVTAQQNVTPNLITQTAVAHSPTVAELVPYSEAIAADSPVAWWRMGEASGSVLDEIGSADGTVTGTVTRDVTGLVTDDDGAIQFAASSYVSGTLGAAIGNVFSLEAMVKLPASGTSTLTYFSSKGSASNISISVIRSGGADSNFIIKGYIFSGSAYQMVVWTADSVVAAGGTYHIVWTRAGTTAAQNIIYINGVNKFRSGGITQAVVNTDTTFYIAGFEGTAETFNNIIDEVALYNYELTAAQVTTHYLAVSVAGGPATQNVDAGLISQTAVASAPTITTGAVSVTPNLITQTAVIHQPTITTANAIVVAQINQTAVIFTPTVTTANSISIGLISQTATASSPTITTANAISVGLIDQAAVANAPTVTTGAAALSVGIIDRTAATFTPTVTTGAVAVLLGLIDQTAAIFSPAIANASSVLLDLIDRTAIANAPTVYLGYEATVRFDNPVHWWRLGEPSGSVIDSGSGADNGTTTGTVTRDVTGLINTTNDDGAVSFAASSYVSGTLDAPIGNVFSVEAWVKLPASGTGTITYFSTKGAASNVSIAVLRGSAGSSFCVAGYIYDGALYDNPIRSADSAVAAGGTYHVVWTRAGTTGAQNKLYINGVDVAATTPATQAVVNTDTTFWIGGFEGASETWVSTMDEVAVYDTALSGARVLAHYNAGLAATQNLSPGLIDQTATASAPVVSLGSAPQSLTPGLIDQTATISAPTITTTVAVTVAQIAQTAATFTPTITSLATISAGLITQAAAASAPTISVGAAPISAGLITQTAATFTPTITTGAVSVSPNFITQTATASAPTITKLNSISLGLISQTAATFSPVITTGAVTVSLGLIGQGSSAFAPTVVAGTTYYISPSGNDSTGSGAIGSPWKTLGKFYSVADPGDTLYCRGGSYTKVGDGYYLDNISGTADNPITVRNYPDEVPVFHPSDGTSGTGELYFRFGSKYHVIDGLEFRGYDPVQSAIIGIGGDYGEGAQPLSGYITIRNCVFELNAPFEAAYYQTNHCIYPDRYTTDVTVEDCEFIGKRTTGQQLTGGGVHIYHDSTSTGVNTTIQRCVFKGFYKAIWIWDDDITGLIDHCTFMNCGTSIRSHAYDTIEYSNNVNNHDTTGGSFDYDIQETGGGTANAHHNYWNETLGADGSLQAGSDAIGGADDASDAGAIPYVAVQSVTLGLISQAAAASAPTVTRGAVNVSAGLITQTAQIHAATITTGAVNITAGLITQTAATFTPTITKLNTIALGLINRTAAASAPTITAVVSASVGIIDQTAQPRTPTITTANTVSVGLITQAAAALAPSVGTGIALGLITQTAATFAPATTSLFTITVGQIDRTATASAPTISTGATSVSPNLINQTAVAHDPTTSAGGTVVELTLINRTAVASAPTITVGAVNVSLGLISQTAQIHTPSLTTTYAVALGLVNQTATIAAATITKLNTISVGLINQAAATFAPTVVQQQFATVARINQTATAFDVVINTGQIIVALSTVNQTATAQQPTITTGSVNVSLGLINRTATASTPAVLTFNTVAVGLINQSASANAPTVETGAAALSVGLINRTAAAFTPSISTGAFDLILDPINQPADTFTPSISTSNALLLTRIDQTAAALDPTITLIFDQDITLTLINQTAIARTPYVAGGDVEEHRELAYVGGGYYG